MLDESEPRGRYTYMYQGIIDRHTFKHNDENDDDEGCDEI